METTISMDDVDNVHFLGLDQAIASREDPPERENSVLWKMTNDGSKLELRTNG